MPALLIRMSIAPNRSSVRSTARRRVSSEVRSPAVITAAAPPTLSRFDSERAVSDRRAPARANSAAHAAPIPSEAPVINTILPSIFTGTGHNSIMPSRLIPLFPLQVVVFPRTPLPLHIFEDRYKEMVGDAIRDNTEFGIVLAKENGIVNAGCTVTVEKVLEMYSDGRMDILARGRRRFEVLSLNEDKDYLQGEVNFFDDEDFDKPPEELRTQALSKFEDLSGLDSSRS